MWEELALLFTSMQWYVILMLCLGVFFVVIECFTPDFGVSGIIGLSSIAGGIITHAILTKSVVQVIGLILIFSMVLIILFLIFVRSARFGLLGKTPFVEKKTAVPTDYADKRKNPFINLIGKTGLAITPLRPSGKFVLDEKVYEGISIDADLIEKGSQVKVVDVEGIKIIVERLED